MKKHNKNAINLEQALLLIKSAYGKANTCGKAKIFGQAQVINTSSQANTNACEDN